MVIHRPDIILLILDTQRFDRLSCYGYGRETSPYLDTFAAEATRFHAAYAAAQWTIPSHTSMFTGRYPSEHQTVQPYSHIPATIPTLAERLLQAGYHTSAFCNNPLVGVVDNGLRRGFQSFLNYSGLLTSHPNQAGMRNPSMFDTYRQWFKGRLAAGLATAQDAFARSDLLLSIGLMPFMVPIWQTTLSFKGNTGKSLRDAADLMVNRHGISDEQPIFCFINLMETHLPYHPATQYADAFVPELRKSKAARRYLAQMNSDVFGWLTPLAQDFDAESQDILDGMYDAEIATQDRHIGTFFEQLRTSGRLDKTLVIVCADHGEHLGEKHFMGHSSTVYNELVHVPLLVRDPQRDFPRGGVVATPVSTRRVFHTALAAAGIATADEAQFTLANHDKSDPDGKQVFSEAVPITTVLSLMQKRRPDLIKERKCDQPRRAIIQTDHKLIETGAAQVELFHRADDPKEELDLHAMLPEIVESMQATLHTFVAQSATAPSPGETVTDFDNPQVHRRLRDLGYLE